MEYLSFFSMAVASDAMVARKGYNFFIWLFASGMLGLIVRLFLPYANKSDKSEMETTRLQRKGNMAGGIVMLFGVILVTVV